MNFEKQMTVKRSVQAWKTALGEDQVICSFGELAAYLSDVAEYPARESIAILKASTIAEVQEILRISNDTLTPVYPISTGKNWGFGSAKPVQDGCAILDLGEMNHIRELNLEDGYAIIEPGVTQRQLSDVLMDTPFMLNVTGSCRDTSIIGNALDRGVGFFRQRTDDIMGLEVVLANGEILPVGSFWSNGLTSFHYKHGIGPDLLPLFFQSNFGVVTAAVVSLVRRPEQMRLVEASFKGSDLQLAVDTAAHLYQQGLLRVVSKAFNTSAMHTYGLQGEKKKGIDELEFSFFTALHGDLASIASIEAIVVGKLDKAGCFYNQRIINQQDWSTELPDQIGLPFQGIPTCKYIVNSFGTTCDRISTDAATGLFLFVPIIPLDGNSIMTAYAILEQTMGEFHIPINASINMIPPRIIDLVISISFSRTPSEIQRAHAAKEVLHNRFRAKGLLPYRADIEHQQPKTLYANQIRINLLSQLKRTFDPNNIISPGRYATKRR